MVGDSKQQISAGFGVTPPSCRQAGEVEHPRRRHHAEQLAQFGSSPLEGCDVQSCSTHGRALVGFGEHRGGHSFDAQTRQFGVDRTRIRGSEPEFLNLREVGGAEEESAQVMGFVPRYGVDECVTGRRIGRHHAHHRIDGCGFERRRSSPPFSIGDPVVDDRRECRCPSWMLQQQRGRQDGKQTSGHVIQQQLSPPDFCDDGDRFRCDTKMAETPLGVVQSLTDPTQRFGVDHQRVHSNHTSSMVRKHRARCARSRAMCSIAGPRLPDRSRMRCASMIDARAATRS